MSSESTKENLTSQRKPTSSDGSKVTTSGGTNPHFPNITIPQRERYLKQDTAPMNTQAKVLSVVPTDYELQLKLIT
jgi:hypothetical protein